VGWVILLIAAILFGVVGFVVKVLKWMLIIAVVLFVAGFVTGIRSR
jgi:hypothetical protein